MKTLKYFLSEGKVVEKDGIFRVSLTKKQKEEVSISIDNSEHPESLGEVKGNKLVMTKEQAKNMGKRLEDDYDPNWGLESLSKALTKSLFNLGKQVSDLGK